MVVLHVEQVDEGLSRRDSGGLKVQRAERAREYKHGPIEMAISDLAWRKIQRRDNYAVESTAWASIHKVTQPEDTRTIGSLA